MDHVRPRTTLIICILLIIYTVVLISLAHADSLTCINCSLASINSTITITTGTIGGGGVGSCASYDLVCQGFETATTGYDNSETWTPNLAGGTITPTYATSPAPLEGTQSLRVVGAGAFAGTATTKTFTASSSVYTYAMVNVAASYYYFFDIAGYCSLLVDNSNQWNVECGGGTATDGSMTAGTYYVWLEYVKGTGSNGICRAYISATTTKPGSPTVQKTNCTNTLDANQISLMSISSSAGTIAIFDHVRAQSTGAIGSNPQ